VRVLKALNTRQYNFKKTVILILKTLVQNQLALVSRYESLLGPIQVRNREIESAVKLQKLVRDIDDEEVWIREKEPVILSQNYG
jgi:spectrin alpha